jgi:hypothetical protein
MDASRFRGAFFDRRKVKDAADRAERRNLLRFGAFVRRTAKFSIRKRKKVSDPGDPPHSHTGILRRFIFFGLADNDSNVVIGPAKTNQVFFDADGKPVRGTVPQVLEEGGRIRVLEVFRFGRWERADLRSRRRLGGLPTRLRTVKIAARPFMGPALRENLPKVDDIWRNSIRR